MYIRIILFLLLVISFFIDCKNQKSGSISDKGKEILEVHQVNEPFIRNSENTPPVPPGMYYHGTKDGVAPDGKLLRVYNSEIFETQWGPVYDSPVIYLYDKDNVVLATYNVFESIFNSSWGGDIIITYNNERNSFDLVFSLDAYGNYGTAHIDLNTNEFVRDLLTIPSDGKKEAETEPEDYEKEGATLKKIDPTIFSKRER